MVVINESKSVMADSIAAATMAAANLASRAGVTSASLLKSTVDIKKDVSEKESEKPIHPRLFNKIVLTLENSLIPVEKLDETPSHQDGLDAETEKDLRILGCELIQTAGILLKLPQVAMATGQVLFQRFFYSKSFVRHNMETVAMSCLCLASKIEEAPRRIRDVINVFHHIKQVRAQKEIMPMVLDQIYTNLKTQVIKAERRVLKELGFCVHVKHPHKLIVMYLQVLKYESHQKLMQMSWNFMNDSLRTDVFMRYNPETIACACIYLSARKLAIPLPKKPQWFSIFRVHENDIVDICYRVMELYVRAKPNMEKLEAAVDELKKKYMESRNKTKEQLIQQQQPPPPAVTTVDRNDTSHNAWGGFIQRAIPLPLPEKSPVDRRSHSRSRSRSRSHSRSRSRSHSRSRTRSASPRGRKKAHRRTRSRSNSTSHKTKKKSRRYSDSSLSPSQSKHHRRKASRERERDRDRDRDRERDRDRDRERERDRDRDRERNRDRYDYSSHHSSKHHRSYNSHRSSYSSRGSTKQYESDRSRDRKR